MSYPFFNSDILMTTVSFVNIEYFDTYINPSEYPAESQKHPAVYPSESQKHPSESMENTPPNSPELLKLLELLPPKQALIIELIFNNGSIERKELAEKLNIAETTAKDHLEVLTKKGLIIREGTKGGRWIIQFKKNKI